MLDLMQLWVRHVHFSYWLMCCVREERHQHGHAYFVERERVGRLSILGSLLATHPFGKELQMERINLANNILHVDASLCAESNAPVYIMELHAKNIVGMWNLLYIDITDKSIF